MKTHTIIRSWGALSLGIFFAAVTARVVLDDVWNGAPFTLTHVNTCAALIGAIASGHMIWPSLKKADIAAALGLAVIFVGASGYIVISSGGRNAEAMQAKAAAIIKTNGEREAQRRKVSEAEADLAEAKDTAKAAADAAAKECASGKKARCEGRIETRDNAARDLEKAESHAALMRGYLSLIGPEELPFAGYKSTAKALEAFGLGKADELEGRMILTLPFISVMISEVGCLTFLMMALGHRQPSPAKAPANDVAPSVPAKRIPGKPTPPKGGRRGRKSDARVLDFSEAFSRKHGRTPTGGEIRAKFPDLPTSTAYDYAARCRVLNSRNAA